MSKIDFIVGIIINYYKFILLGVAILYVVRTIIGYHIKITVEQICPNCNTMEAERIPRNFLEKLIQQFNSSKKFKCLKCWKIYYVR